MYRKLDITRRGQLAGALTGVLDDSGEDSSATAMISLRPRAAKDWTPSADAPRTRLGETRCDEDRNSRQ